MSILLLLQNQQTLTIKASISIGKIIIEIPYKSDSYQKVISTLGDNMTEFRMHNSFGISYCFRNENGIYYNFEFV